MTAPPKQESVHSFVRRITPQSSRKTIATAEARSGKGHFGKLLPEEFRRDGISCQQIAWGADTTIYQQPWNYCPYPAVCFEVIRVKRREGFRIGGRFIEAAEAYPKSEVWGVDVSRSLTKARVSANSANKELVRK